MFKRNQDFKDKIIIGKTKNKAIVSICKNCEYYPETPHLNYYDKKKNQEYSVHFLKAKMIDHGRVLNLDQREDLDRFLSEYNEKAQMTNWELAVKIWNENYKVQIPCNLHRPFYMNIQIEPDKYIISTYNNREGLPEGINIYCDDDIESKPHFHISFADGVNIAIMFEKPEYLEPLSRKLTEDEIETLIKYLNQPSNEESFKNSLPNNTNWEYLKYAWNNENKYQSYVFPKKKILKEDLKMPDYGKLNNPQ